MVFLPSSQTQKRCFNETLHFTGEVGTVITKNNSASELKQAEGSNQSGKIEEEFTVARLYVSKMKSEVKNLVHKATLLEASQADGLAKNETMEKELSEARLLVGQHEAKMQSMNEAIKDNETKKRQLEEDIDSLNEEISQLKATEEMNKVASDKREEDREMKEALEQQISQHREAHQKQVAQLRNDITDKQTLIGELKDEKQKLSLAFDQLQRDHEKLKVCTISTNNAIQYCSEWLSFLSG